MTITILSVCYPHCLNKIMKAYDYQEDRSSIARSQHKHQQLQHFDDDLNFSKLTSEINQINFQVKSHETSIKKMQREVEGKVTESQLTETIALINAGIHMDPNMVKLLKTKEGYQDEEEHKVKMNALLFARKLNQMSESVSVLLAGLKRLQGKIGSVQDDLNMQLNQKSNSLQLQLQEVRGQTNKQSMELNQRMQLMSFQLNDKMRDMDTKLTWKLNEFKSKIDDKINEEMVLMYLENMEKKMDKNMQDFQVRSNIDPGRVDMIEAEINKNRIAAEDRITQCSLAMRKVQLEMESSLVKLDEYSHFKINIQKRLSLFNENFMDVYKRVLKCEKDEVSMHQNIDKLMHDDAYVLEELKRINTVLLNLKISDDFQRMLEEMNPTKVLELQDSVNDVKSEQTNIFREIAVAKREIAIITAKSENMGFAVPNKEREKLKKEELYAALDNFLIDNQFAQKISNLDKQVTQYRNSMDSVALLSRQVARLQKESEYHRLVFEMKNLEEYLKKELAIMNGKIKEKLIYQPMQFNLNDRPISQGRSSLDQSSLPQAQMGRTLSTKKLHQIASTHRSRDIAQTSRQLLEMKAGKR